MRNILIIDNDENILVNKESKIEDPRTELIKNLQKFKFDNVENKLDTLFSNYQSYIEKSPEAKYHEKLRDFNNLNNESLKSSKY